MPEYPLEVWWAMLNDWLLGAALLVIWELRSSNKKLRSNLIAQDASLEIAREELHYRVRQCRDLESRLRGYFKNNIPANSPIVTLADKCAELDRKNLEVNSLRKSLAQAESEAASAKLTLSWLTKNNLS